MLSGSHPLVLVHKNILTTKMGLLLFKTKVSTLAVISFLVFYESNMMSTVDAFRVDERIDLPFADFPFQEGVDYAVLKLRWGSNDRTDKPPSWKQAQDECFDLGKVYGNVFGGAAYSLVTPRTPMEMHFLKWNITNKWCPHNIDGIYLGLRREDTWKWVWRNWRDVEGAGDVIRYYSRPSDPDLSGEMDNTMWTPGAHAQSTYHAVGATAGKCAKFRIQAVSVRSERSDRSWRDTRCDQPYNLSPNTHSGSLCIVCQTEPND